MTYFEVRLADDMIKSRDKWLNSCVVVADVHIEQSISMLDLLKVNFKDHRGTFSKVSLVDLLNSNVFCHTDLVYCG